MEIDRIGGVGMSGTDAASPEQPSSSGDMRAVYWILGAVVLILVVVGLITYNGDKSTAEAQQKAQELSHKFQQAGLPVPADLNIIVKSLGTDGGAVCANPANALGKAVQNDMLTNGADFVGRRPVIVDRRILLGEALILQTYCPEKLQPYQHRIEHLKTAHTIKG
jgi:hypothetical protein